MLRAIVLRAIVWGFSALLHSLVCGGQRLDKDRLRELLNAYISMRQDLRNLLTLKKQVCYPRSTVTLSLSAHCLSAQYLPQPVPLITAIGSHSPIPPTAIASYSHFLS